MVGIIKDQKYYITDISQVKLMFPNGLYETWDDRFWQKDYLEAQKLKEKCLTARAKQCIVLKQGLTQKVNNIYCELCHVNNPTPEDFVAHCMSNKDHLALEKKFNSSDYDQLLSDKSKTVST